MNKKSPYIYIFLFFVSLYFSFSIGHYGGDGYEDYLTAESIVLDGNIELHDRPQDPDQLNYKTDVGIKGADGKTYSSRGSLGVPVLLSIFYAIGHLFSFAVKQAPHDYITMLFVSFYNPFVSAVNVLLVFAISRRLDFKPATCLALSFVYGLATMAPVYTRTGFAEPTLILFLLLSAYFLILYSREPKTRYLLYASLAIAYCVFTRVAGLIFIPCFVFYMAWVSFEKKGNLAGRIRPFVVFSTVMFLCVFAVLAFNYSIYGNWTSFGGYHSVSGAKRILQAPHFMKGMYYYLFSTGKGVFFYNLPLLFVIFVIKKVIDERRKEGVLFLLVFLVALLVYAKSFRRGSLFAWGPRYLLPSVPFLTFLVGYYLESFKGLIAKISVALISVLGFFIMLPCMFINQSKFYFFIKERLGLDEYLINFIPDLSPIKGAWWMFVSRIIQGFGGPELRFVFDPDYKLVQPLSALMEGYNYLDLWFLKVVNIAPSFAPVVYAVLLLLTITAVISFYKTFSAR